MFRSRGWLCAWRVSTSEPLSAPLAQKWEEATGGLIALILVALAFGDSKLIFGRYTSQTVQLDRAIADPAELKAALEQRLGASVASVNVVKLDLVNDLTLVDVRSKVA